MTRIRSQSVGGTPVDTSPVGPGSTTGGTTPTSQNLSSSTGLTGRSAAAVDRPPPRRTNSLPLPGSSYQLPERQAVPGPNPQTLYHLTANQNAESIRDSGGLMPLAHPRNNGAGLDAQRGDEFPGAEQAVAQHLGHVQEINRMGLDGGTADMLLRGSRNNTAETLRNGANSQTLYMSHGDGSRDYMLREPFVSDGATLMRAQLDPQANGFVRDAQGGSEDHRALGLTVPSSQLEYVQLSGQQVRELGSGDQPLNNLPWRPMPGPGDKL